MKVPNAGLAILVFLPIAAAAQDAGGTLEAGPSAFLPLQVQVDDAPNDDGRALHVSWTLPDAPPGAILGIDLLRRRPGAAPSEDVVVASLPATAGGFTDGGLEMSDYLYGVRVLTGEGLGPVLWSEAARPTAQWFDKSKITLLAVLVFVSAAILVSLNMATRGRRFFIRKIAGMDAVEEAVGRATEMGKPVLFIAGIQDMDNVQTVAGLTILGSIARMTAKYEAGLHVPTSRSLVMSTARETIKESYTLAGRPDLYSEGMSHYISDEQFGFVAAVDGIMLRERPAACFYMGAFFAESLILAETGNSIGAIQIAGTAQPTQLPFFVAACDYTLIGEELFAASAYLSQDPRILGSLRGQDIGKGLAMLAVVAGTVLESIGVLTGSGGISGLAEALRGIFSAGF